MSDYTSRSVEFGTPGSRIRGTFYHPRSGSPAPVVVMAHGWAMCAGGDLQSYAAAIAARGLAALAFDFRRLGRSEGEPRQELNPYDQIDDYRDAITWACLQSEVNADAVGVWGTSYSGGHALVLAATDSRVRAVVAQVPTISGFEAGRRKATPARQRELNEAFHRDRAARLQGLPPTMLQTVGAVGETVAYPDADSRDYMLAHGALVPEWRNETTLQSLAYARAYEPGTWIDRIGPVPLLMIVADSDTVTPVDLQLDAYTRAREPKTLHIITGGHYSPYVHHLTETAALAADWFQRHLITG